MPHALPSHPTSNEFRPLRNLDKRAYILAIIEDEDDAATLRADLRRSNLSRYAIQRCARLEDGLRLMYACQIDLVYLGVDSSIDIASHVEQLKNIDRSLPIIGLSTRRQSDLLVSKNLLTDLVAIEDLSPSLAERVTKAAIETSNATAEKELLQQQLALALEVGKLGTWRYLPTERQFNLDAISSAMFGLAARPTTLSFDDARARVYPADQPALAKVLEGFKENEEIAFRLQGDTIPLIQITLVCQKSGGAKSTIIGIARKGKESQALHERISEAKYAIQNALDAREEALRVANSKLQALASELGQPIPKIEPRLPAPPEAPKPERPSEANAQASIPQPATIETTPKPIKTPTPEYNAQATFETASTPKPPAKEATLAIDKQAAFQDVLRSIARHQEGEEDEKADTLPFDFAQQPANDFDPPDPGAEGFIHAVERLVGLTQIGHGLNVNLSIDDQSSIEQELESTLIYEVLKELLTNVVKHSKATICLISLFRDEDEWVLQVEDDGIGLGEGLKSITSPLNKIGLFRIRTQLALKGGHLDMTPASPNGLLARARLPVALTTRQKAQS